MSNLQQSDGRKMKNKGHQSLSLWSKVIFFDVKLICIAKAETGFTNSDKWVFKEYVEFCFINWLFEFVQFISPFFFLTFTDIVDSTDMFVDHFKVGPWS